MSFAFFAFSFISGIAISTVVSIAEFTSSNDITSPNNIIHVIHSCFAILNTIPDIITNIIIVINVTYFFLLNSFYYSYNLK